MSESLIVAIITAAVSTAGSYSLMSWRLKEVEKRLDNHNHYAEKFASSSTDIALMKKDIEYIKEKLDK